MTTVKPYKSSISVGDTVYISGQLPVNLKGEVDSKEFGAQVRTVFENIERVLHEEGCHLENIVHMKVYLTDLNNMTVLNEIFGEVFKGNFPTRSAFEVSGLVKDVLVEIDAIAHRHYK